MMSFMLEDHVILLFSYWYIKHFAMGRQSKVRAERTSATVQSSVSEQFPSPNAWSALPPELLLQD